MATPEEFGIDTSTVAGWVGGAGAAIVAAVLGLRRWLSSDAVARAEDDVNIEFLRTLMEQVKTANERADKAEEERNAAIRQIGELKAQIATLQMTVNHMQAQLDRMTGGNLGVQ